MVIMETKGTGRRAKALENRFIRLVDSYKGPEDNQELLEAWDCLVEVADGFSQAEKKDLRQLVREIITCGRS